jgi:energy-coupling factor transporter ATP-binding protein EcfA2
MSQELNDFASMTAYCEKLTKENSVEESLHKCLFPAMYALPVSPIQEQQLLKTVAARLEATIQAVKAEWKAYKVAHRDESSNEKETQADKLVKLASELELFHDADSVAFAALSVNGHREVYKLRSKSFRAWLQRAFYQNYGHAASAQAIQDALGTLEGKATFEGKASPVFVRLAEHEGRVYLDLADDAWRVVEVSHTGWRVLTESPVYFWRPKGVEPLPVPVHGGSLKDLRKFVNLSDEHFILLFSFLVACLHPGIPYPLLILTAEQGSGKSTLARMIKALVDPATAPLRSQPRDEETLALGATNALLVAFDNLSSIPKWLSDALSRLSTGGGFSKRENYTDADEVIFNIKRPALITGITDLATESDLVDRAIVIEPKRITTIERKTETNLWAEFETFRPALLGALLTAVSHGLATKDSIKFDELPRMADFATWAAACEQNLGLEKVSFMNAYTRNRDTAHEIILEGNPIAFILRNWLKADGAKFEGTFGRLLDELHQQSTDDTKRLKDFPKTAKALSNSLKRLAPNLRGVGIEVTFLGHSEHGNRVRLKKVAKNVQDVQNVQDEDENDVQDEETQAERKLNMAEYAPSDVQERSGNAHPEKNRPGRQNSAIAEQPEGAERLKHVYSDEEAIEYDPA